VQVELQNFNWIRRIRDITDPSMMGEFVMLFVALSSVVLNDQNDEILWKWSPNGKFSVASAYQCQFIGATTPFPTQDIWKAQIEPRCRFFAWLAMHNKPLTADNMMKRNWECNPECPLCFCQHETASHILTECNFTEALWRAVSLKHGLPDYNHIPLGAPIEWVRFMSAGGTKKMRRRRLGTVFTFWWNVWKERNKRIFDNAEQSVPQLLRFLEEELSMHSRGNVLHND
jgi:hypothetical protein